MSDRTSGAWRVCSLDGFTAWKCPEPTKWAVVVKDGARATTRENEVFSAKIAKLIWPLEPVRHFDYDGPFRRRGTLPGCHLKTSSREHTLFAPDDRPDIMLGPTVRGVGVNNCTRIHTYRSPYCVTVRSLNREGGGSDRHFRTNEYESTALTLPDRTSLRPNSEHPRSRSGCKVWTRVLYTRRTGAGCWWACRTSARPAPQAFLVVPCDLHVPHRQRLADPLDMKPLQTSSETCAYHRIRRRG